MYIFNKFTASANTVLNLAIEQAEKLGHTFVGTEHILLGILKEGKTAAACVLKELGVSYRKYFRFIEESLGSGDKTNLCAEDFTPKTKRVLKIAVMESAHMNKEFVDTEVMLLALAQELDSSAVIILTQMGINIDDLLFKMDVILDESTNKEKIKDLPEKTHDSTKLKMLPKFSENLIESAKRGNIDPVIGRDDEIRRMVAVLSRRRKNNPCLIGEAGVGKTALAEGLALRIEQEQVPDFLLDKQIYALDLNLVIAGTKYRGDFEDRIKGIIDEVKENKNIILFIDEIHTIVGAGSSEGGVDAANIMKPLLSKGDFKVIGATTLKEYRKYIEKDSALERRFAKIYVDEPTKSQTKNILFGLRDKLEEHHHIEIKDEAIEAAVNLSKRYITNRCLPDKAIDLIDEAAATLRSRWKDSKPEDVLCQRHIQEVVSGWTDIPISELTMNAGKRLACMEDTINSAVIGQREAVKSLCNAIRRGRVGISSQTRPIGSFMFLGASGVGKTLLCKTLAKQIFLKEKSLIKLDMSEYMEKHSVSKLIGSPPGYVGFDEGGYLSERVSRHPYSVVVFDEIEKAHPDVSNLLLQVLDEGVLTDAQGRLVDFKNTIIIFTSNIGSDIISENRSALGFSPEDSPEKDRQRLLFEELKKHFKTEFLNRLDEIIVFRKLGRSDIEAITRLELGELSSRAAKLGLELAFSDNCVKALSSEAYSEKFGAREIKRTISKRIENLITDSVLLKKFEPSDSVLCDFQKNSYKFIKTNEKVIAS